MLHGLSDAQNGTVPRNGGYCSRCDCWHELPWEEAWECCHKLMAELKRTGRIDCMQPQEQADPRYHTSALFNPGGGKMLGLLLCRDSYGVKRPLFAFSGMFNGLWLVDGWAPPIFALQDFLRLHAPVERQIKELGAQIASLPVSDSQRPRLRMQRRELSRANMAAIHALYQLHNFRGESRPLPALFPKSSGPPSGTGDCCAPKLLRQAQRLGWQPLSMAEFYWGKSNASGSKEHGRRYAPCASKCQPILGFQLCGL